MKTITLSAFFLLSCLLPQAQKPIIKQLAYLAGSSFLWHTAYQEEPGTTAFKNLAPDPSYLKDSLTSRYLIKKLQGQKPYLQVQKLTAADYDQFKRGLLSDGFLQNRTPGTTYTDLFQKKNITISAVAEMEAQTGLWYKVSVEKRPLPRMKDLQHAEDLLSFDSHQHLLFAFGQQNVSQEKFYEEDGSSVDCSVIYPGSSKEVVFLWQDPENLRQLQCIRIGGNIHTSGAQRFSNRAAQNQWVSKQGLYATMTLNQLQTRNDNTVSFYGWGGGSKATLCPSNSGLIDFSGLDLALGCLNCNDDAYYGKQQLASNSAIDDGRRIFIATMIFYPPATSNE